MLVRIAPWLMDAESGFAFRRLDLQGRIHARTTSNNEPPIVHPRTLT